MLVGVALVVSAAPLAAQTDYYHTDAGRPVRVEDASATPRGGFELHLAPVRVERIEGGFWRMRIEPKLAAGLLPRTEFSVRVPFARIVDRRTIRGGLAGIGVGVLHALSTETGNYPAFAVGGELVAPVGPLASPDYAWSLRANATRTLRVGRFHLNGSLGTYSITPPPPPPVCTPPGSLSCIDQSTLTPTPFLPDVPCLRDEHSENVRLCMPATATSSAPIASDSGWRWLAGVGFDKAFPFRSVLLGVDVVAERLVGLSPSTDVTAEAGVRMQATPWIVLDAGFGWRFRGVRRAVSGTLGATYAFGLRGPRPR